MIKYYKIPKNVNYVNSITQIEEWEEIDKINHDIPTAIVVEESKMLKGSFFRNSFAVVYKGMIQTPGGTGSCYNPAIKTFITNLDPMNNHTMPRHMNKWKLYDHNILLRMVIQVKLELLKITGIEGLPMFAWKIRGYRDFPIDVIIKLNAIGNRFEQPTILEAENKKQLLLSLT